MNSYWKERNKQKFFQPLEENIQVDVCILGGGLTGLSCAYKLTKQTDLKVCVVEKDSIGSHTSGNNTGKLTSQHGLFYSYLIESQGRDFAKNYLLANEEAIEEVEAICKEEQIDCDFERRDHYVLARTPEDVEKVRSEVNAVNSLNVVKAKFIEQFTFPLTSVLAGIQFPHQAQFNPYEYAIGLR